jgi:hypothetical protein
MQDGRKEDKGAVAVQSLIQWWQCLVLSLTTMSTKKDRALEDISDHKSTASRLRSHLSEIEGQIAVLESQIALLCADRETVLVDLAAIAYPILTLPNEIARRNFYSICRCRTETQSIAPGERLRPVADSGALDM